MYFLFLPAYGIISYTQEGVRKMIKETYVSTLQYTYDPEHRGARYCIDGKKYCNVGELLESIAKHHRGLEYLRNPTTKWNEGSDIEEENASVKSGKASLACLYGESIEEVLEKYFAEVASNKWIYMVMLDDLIVEYHMNAKEFYDFCFAFGRLVAETGHPERKKVRLLATSAKTIQWLEEKIS